MNKYAFGGVTPGLPRPLAHHPHTMASGLASLGRHGDSMLVHMSPEEVGGLQSLAQAHGKSLTTNPNTGLPEAFSLGTFAKGLLPTIGGALLDAYVPGADALMPEIAIGAGLVDKLSGASTADAINLGMGVYGGSQVTSGMNKMGQAPLATAYATDAANVPVSGPALETMGQSMAAANALTPTEFMPNSTSLDSLNSAAGGEASQEELQKAADASNTAPQYARNTSGTFLTSPTRTDVIGQGMQQFADNPSQASKDFYNTLGDTNYQRMAKAYMMAMPVLNAYTKAATPSTPSSSLGASTGYQFYVPAPGYKTLWNQGTVNPLIAKLGYLPAGQPAFIGAGWNPGAWSSTPGANTGTVPSGTGMKAGGLASLKHYAAGGASTAAGAIPTSVGEAILATNAPLPTTQMGTDQATLQAANAQYQNGLLNALAQNPNMNLPPPPPNAENSYLSNLATEVLPQPYTNPYAGMTGGSGSSGGGKNIGETAGSEATGGSGSLAGAGSGVGIDSAGIGNGTIDTSGTQDISSNVPLGDTVPATPPGSTPSSKPSSNNSGLKGLATNAFNEVQGFRSAHPFWSSLIGGMALGPLGALGNMVLPKGQVTVEGDTVQGTNQTSSDTSGNAPDTSASSQNIANQANSDSPFSTTPYNPVGASGVDLGIGEGSGGFGSDIGGFGSDFGDSGKAGENPRAHGGYIHAMAAGGLGSFPDTYAAGGKLLRGDGDGMSDSIPAVIGGNRPQRAALADGEFVIPADVVSHLGNGSTEAGSKKLYAMMDKVRMARTGNPKQGKQINPDKYLPV